MIIFTRISYKLWRKYPEESIVCLKLKEVALLECGFLWSIKWVVLINKCLFLFLLTWKVVRALPSCVKKNGTEIWAITFSCRTKDREPYSIYKQRSFKRIRRAEVPKFMCNSNHVWQAIVKAIFQLQKEKTGSLKEAIRRSLLNANKWVKVLTGISASCLGKILNSYRTREFNARRQLCDWLASHP